ncbi:uncharacterized protein LOC110100132, partial [Dendrobium catenatum]|uniref:uncharacterized protein LOC110100132 n=1 Tax=Dendrobium catenatum TaxID=906689 RepID=UPI0009F1B606
VKSTNFPVSFVTPAPKLSFRGNDLSEGANFWNLSLVGYSIDPRPYYERLLLAMKKVWNIKGGIIGNGVEGGPWFLLGKPFILQRWNPKFKPVRDENTTIPIWIKIMDLPLALWTPLGISRIASFIGVLISVDTLTANRTRLTFARVCVHINKNSPLPDEIPIEIEGEDMNLKVHYDWKPSPCEGCGSLFHPFFLCSSNPNPKPIIPPSARPRGRSSSRHPIQREQLPTSKPPPPRPTSLACEASLVPLDGILPKPIINTPVILSPEPKKSPTMLPDSTKDLSLPNLNLPMDVASSSE